MFLFSCQGKIKKDRNHFSSSEDINKVVGKDINKVVGKDINKVVGKDINKVVGKRSKEHQNSSL